MAADLVCCHDSGSDTYLALCRDLLDHGGELRSVKAIFTNPDTVHTLSTDRRVNSKVASTLAMHLLGGISSLEQLDLASGGAFTPLADHGRLRNAYGPRAFLQIMTAERALRKGEDAVISVPPATIWFGIRGDYLEMDVQITRSDILTGWPFDIMVFPVLHRALAWSAGTVLGAYRHQVSSLCMNPDARDRVQQIVDKGMIVRQYPFSIPLPQAKPIPDWNRSASFQSQLARGICLRDREDSNRGWLYQNVPFLGPGRRYCPLCRYVTLDTCPECSRPKKLSPTTEYDDPASIDPEKLRPFTGKYVAIRDHEVVAHADDIAGVIQDLRNRQIVAHSVFRVP